MNVRVTIDLPAEKLSELQALLTGNLPSIHDLEREPVPVPEEPAVVAAPNTERKARLDDPVPEQQSSKSATSAAGEVPKKTNGSAKTDHTPVTKEMIRAKGIEITKAGKQDQLAAVFKQFGAANLRSIKEEDYEAVYKILEEIK